MAVTTFHEDAERATLEQDGDAARATLEQDGDAARATLEQDGDAAPAAAASGAVRSAAAAEALLLDVVQHHADEVLSIARTHSLCLDDAHDAYQRSLEQFLRHGRRLREDTAVNWLFTVVKREAQAIRRARSEHVASDAVDFERLEARHDASPEDHVLAADAVTRGAEALRSLKPQEMRALWLRADGRSYAEIQRATGWSYTKVNRCLSEGRRAFLARCAELEAGTDCRRWSGVLAALAGGEARAEDLVALRPHLRHCTACKATLRSLHASSASMATVLPPVLAGAAVADGRDGAERLGAAGSWLARLWEAVAGPAHERAATGALKWQAAVEAAAGGKVAAVAASTVALAGGGAVVAREAAPPPARTTDRAAAVAPLPGEQSRARPGALGAGSAAPARHVPAPARGVSGRPPGAPVVGARPAGGVVAASRPGTPGAREFGVRAGPPDAAEQEFGPTVPSRREVRARAGARSAVRTRSAARVRFAAVSAAATPRGTRVARGSAAPPGTDFGRAPVAAPQAAAGTAASRRPPSRSAPSSPAASEFGP